jgi:hypothetical protein
MLFDDIARLVASPMPRRAAVKLLIGTIAGSAAGLLWPSRARAGDGACGDDCLFTSDCQAGLKCNTQMQKCCKDVCGTVTFVCCCKDCKGGCCPPSVPARDGRGGSVCCSPPSVVCGGTCCSPSRCITRNGHSNCCPKGNAICKDCSTGAPVCCRRGQHCGPHGHCTD